MFVVAKSLYLDTLELLLDTSISLNIRLNVAIASSKRDIEKDLKS